MSFIPAELLKKKRFGGEHSDEEIAFLIESYTKGSLPDYQMSAWLMAVCLQGMSARETTSLTRQMLLSGKTLDFSSLSHRIDKHSTGGVGDKTSMILGPIVAAAGIHVPMIAGRGLGHTGGTLDKLESLPGFNVFLRETEFIHMVCEHRLAIMGQTAEICPSDRKLYALRDVTGTVSSLPLICGSIMSKKLAEDLTGLVLDVKWGSGAFMKTEKEALALAQLLKAAGENNGLRVTALITDMNQPLGRFAGNANEIFECIEILQNKKFIENSVDFYADTRELSLILAGHMIYLADKSDSPEKGMRLARQLLESGAAWHEFKALCQRQSCSRIEVDFSTKFSTDVVSPVDGILSSFDCEAIGLSAVELGAGRLASTDSIDSASGIEIKVKLGMKMQKGQAIATLNCNDKSKLQTAKELFERSFTVTESTEKSFSVSQLVTHVLS